MKELGERIRARRIELCLKQEELAERISVTRQTISNYERGTSEPDLDTLQRLADVLGLRLEELVQGKREQKSDQKKERLLFVSGLIGTAVLAAVFFYLSDWALDYKAYTYDPKPYLKVYMLLLPAVLLLLGWTVLQEVACFTELPELPLFLRIAVRLLIAGLVVSYVFSAVPWLWDFKILDEETTETAFVWAENLFQRGGRIAPIVLGLLLRLTHGKNNALTNGQDMV